MATVTVVDFSGLNNTVSADVVVGRSALVALIAGGDRIVGKSEGTLELDAGSSYDPDVPNAPLGEYRWACAVVEGSMTSCGDEIESLADSAITQQLTEFSAPGRYMFTVTTLKDTRNASASVVIEVSSDTVPTVGIAALDLPKANPSKKLVLPQP